jgi:serine/threonine protein kinase
MSDGLIDATIADRYQIISQLGVGGMGVAYRAWDLINGIPVVIKIPKRTLVNDPRFNERFLREIRLLQGLQHPYIVPIRDTGEHNGLPYVVMRFLPGGSLSNRRLRDEVGKPKPNPPGMLALWLPAVASALDHIHAVGVVHRDVKPGNIFFDAFWNPFLGDFGIATITDESEAFDRELTLTATGMLTGTPEYMAPERCIQDQVIDGRSDQYALAVVVYEIVAGLRPFTGNQAQVIGQMLTQRPPRLDTKVYGVPPGLSEAVHRGLAKAPDERFSSCTAFADAVLRDVPRIDDDPDVARLLCPRCATILKLPISAAGRIGKCSKCMGQMKVARDLGALWLLEESPRQRRHTPATHSGSDDEVVEDFVPVSDTALAQPTLPLRRAFPLLQLQSMLQRLHHAWNFMAGKHADVRPPVTQSCRGGASATSSHLPTPRMIAGNQPSAENPMVIQRRGALRRSVFSAEDAIGIFSILVMLVTLAIGVTLFFEHRNGSTVWRNFIFEVLQKILAPFHPK